MKKQSYRARGQEIAKVACTVSAAALMLGASHGATVGFNFQCNYCGAHSYSGAIVTAPAFGIAPSGWESLSQMDTGYGCPALYFTLNQTIDTTTGTGGLNPLPNGSLSVTWSAYTANVSGFGGYTRTPPHYIFGGNGYKPGNEQVYWGFLRDGVNFGPGSSGGANNQPGYAIDITGLKSLFTNTPFAIQLISSTDSMQTQTNAFIIDATGSVTQSVVYPSTPPVGDAGGSAWVRGIGGGLSTASGSLNTDHIMIIGNRAENGGDKVTGFDNASTIAGFIVTDKPVISMSPQPVLVCPGDTVVYSGYAVGVPPLTYQWRKNGAPIPGANGTSLGLTNVGINEFGTYDLMVSNPYGVTVSDPVPLDHLGIKTGNNYVVDSNTNGPALHGTDSGATWLASDGTHNGVMSFNGTNKNQIVVPGHTNLNSASGTISFWMRSAGVMNTNGNAAILVDRNGGSGGLLIKQLPTGEIEVVASGSGNVITGLTPVNDNAWHSITVAFDTAANGNVAIYIDGNNDNSGQLASDWSWTPGQELEIGLSHDGQWQAYNGLLDEVRFYNKALTPATLDPKAVVLQLTFDTAPVAGASFSWQCPDAVLQSADNVSGPYSDLTFAVSPYNTIFPGAQKYYRYRATRTPQTIIANPYLM